MDCPSEYEPQVRSRIEGFGIPDWIEQECSVCRSKMTKYDVMGMELDLIPIFLGDVTFTFFCKNCHSSFMKHMKCDAHSFSDIAEAMSGPPQRLVERDELFKNGIHNLRVEDWKTIQTNNQNPQ